MWMTPWETFDPMSAIKKLNIDKVTRTTEEKGPGSCSYKSLCDDDSYYEEDNISENGDEERHLFSSDSDYIFFLVAK